MVLQITAYAEELLRYDGIDWPDRIRNTQRNWIGRSEGAHLDFTVDVDGVDSPLTVFTTRPDTVYGATFMVIAPEHPLVTRVTTPEQRGAVAEYVAATGRTSEVDRLSTEREKTGVFTGAYAVNRFNGARIPIWIADYVLVTYGTGAVMAVPAHDQRDFDFAKKYGLEVVPVYDHAEVDVTKPLAAAIPYGGRMINSGGFDGTPSSDAIRKRKRIQGRRSHSLLWKSSCISEEGLGIIGKSVSSADPRANRHPAIRALHDPTVIQPQRYPSDND